jgi:hypothetical protein
MKRYNQWLNNLYNVLHLDTLAATKTEYFQVVASSPQLQSDMQWKLTERTDKLVYGWTDYYKRIDDLVDALS